MKTFYFKKAAVLLLLCSFSFFVRAQITEVDLGINGLTCSQCSRSVEMRLRKLDFVKNVAMNLEHTEGKVVFKEHKKVDIDKIAQAVVDAGFSVRSLTAIMQLSHVVVSPNNCLELNGDKFQFVQTKNAALNGATTVKFIGEKYLQKKELKKWQPYLKTTCVNNTGKTYYVTM